MLDSDSGSKSEPKQKSKSKKKSKSHIICLTNPPSFIPPWRAIFEGEGNEWFEFNKIRSLCKDKDYEVSFSKEELREGFFDIKGIHIPFGDIEWLIFGYYVLAKKQRIEPLARIKGWLEQLDVKYLTIMHKIAAMPTEVRDNPYELLKIIGELSLDKKNPTREYITQYLSYMKEMNMDTHMISLWTTHDYLLFVDMILYKLFVGGEDMRVIGNKVPSPTTICLSGELIFWLLHLCNYRLAFFWKKIFQYDTNVDIPFGHDFESFCATISFKWETTLMQVMQYDNEYLSSSDDSLIRKILNPKLENHGTWFSSESLFMCHISFLTMQQSGKLPSKDN